MLIYMRHCMPLRFQALLGRCLALGLFLLLGGIFAQAQGGIALVQHKSLDAGTTTSSSLAFNSNNIAGNWIGVVIRAGKSGQVFTVTDSRGNTYRKAIQFNETTDGNTLGIFYAENIAGGANRITVSDTILATLRFAILEYSGVALVNSLDVFAAAKGTGASPNSGNSTTTANGDLVLAAISTANPASFTAGTGYLIEETVPAEPNTKLIAEDQFQAVAGSISAGASLGATDNWGAAMATFKAATGSGGPGPSIASLNPTLGAVGTSVTISGANFGSAQGTSTVTFNGTAATPSSWSATSITVPVPAGATTGNVAVTVGGVASNGVAFTVTVISVSLAPPTATVTTNIGAGFTATVQNDVQSKGVSWSLSGGGCSGNTCGTLSSASPPYTITYIAPPVAPNPATVTLTATSIADPTKASSSTITVVQANPRITSLNPTSGSMSTLVTISGTGFGATQGTSAVTFNGSQAGVSSWSDTSIAAIAPPSATTGNVIVTVGGTPSNGVNFTVIPASPNITNLSPSSGPVGTSVTITGTGFGSAQGSSVVTFNGTSATPSSWGATSIVVPVPFSATTGNIVVMVGGVPSNGVNFTITPNISSINPASGTVGTSVTLSGTSFGAAQGTSTVTFNGTAATPTSWNATGIVVPVPTGAATGNVVVTVGGLASNGVAFTVFPTPSITNLNPTSGQVGASVTISGTNFGTTQGTSTVLFNGVGAATTSWSATNIIAIVPTTTTGDVGVNVGGVASNGVSFTILPPSITSINPTSGPVGASVTIAGTGFGSVQGTITFNGTTATPTSWSATSIVVPVPTGATTGNVVVTVGGLASNGVAFTVTVGPNITSLNPTSGPVGTSVTIAGSNLGATQGTSTITFNGTTATPTSWSATSITVPVPTGAATGNVVVTVGGLPSNGVNFTVSTTLPIAFVQVNSATPQTPQTSVAVPFISAQTAGNLNVVVVGWNDSTATISSITDTKGNVYTLAVGPTIQSGSATQSIYYANNIAPATANGNTVTVAFAPAAGFVDVRIAEYSGLSTVNSLDVAVGAQGNSTTSSSGNVTTTNANDLLIGANLVQSGTTGAGTGFTSRVITPQDADILEDRVVTATGTYSATAPVSPSASWIMQIVAFRGAGGGTTSPSITSLNPTSGPVGTSVTIAGTNFGATQGASTVTFNGTSVTPTSWSATSIVVRVPANATTGNVVVTVGITASNGVAFAVTTPPSITSLNPTSGAIGTSVTITGANFGAIQGTSTVTFNGTAAAPVNWTATSIMVPVPTGASTGNVVVTVGSLASNGVNFAVVAPPSITSLNPTSGAIGTSVTIAGANFGTTQGTSAVTFNGIAATPTSWSATSIAAPVPNGATTGNVAVTVGGLTSNGVPFTVIAPGPSISTLSMTQGPVGASVTITGVNFGASQGGTSTVKFNSTVGAPTSWSDTSIAVPVPVGATTGNVVVTVAGVASNGLAFTVTPPPSITNINPTAGPVGTVVTISGANFGPTVGTRTSVVSFNGTVARPNSWSDTVILVPVPAGATTGNVVVSISGVTSNGVNFTVATPPSITSLTPISGPVGTSVTISGANFGPTQGTSNVMFNGTSATPAGWSDTSITVAVPSGATTGNVTVTVAGLTSTGVNFTVTSSGGAPVVLVQHVSMDAGTTTFASLAFPAANTTGNFIAVIIRAGKTGQVFTVTDAKGNTYRKAIQFNETLDGTTLGIFYAETVAGGANTINVFDSISGTLRFAILEYSGVAIVNSLDVVATKQGAGISPTSGNLLTSVSGDLLLGAISTANATSFTAGSGYLAEELVPLSPNTKLLVEDQIQAAPGQVSAGASLGASDNWGAILAAFKSASGAPPPPITVTVAPATASVGSGGGTQPFTAQLTNDIQSRGVTWSLSGAGCNGSTCGTLSQVTNTSVTYTGPVTIPNPATVTLTATSVADNSKTNTATIAVMQGTLTVTLSPKRGSITTSQTQQFTATVFNDPNNAGVTWQVDGNTNGNSTTGTISAAGLFAPGTQPGLHTITATSVTNASVSGSVSFAVTDLPGVLMHHNDPGRTGQNLKEYALTAANLLSSAFTQLFSCPVNGYVYAQPLWVPNLTVGAAVHNVLFIATEHDSVYAFDADSPSCTQLWTKSFLGTGVTTMPWQDTSLGSSSAPTNDVFPEIGITSTPVIDLATNTIYVVAKTKESVGTGCPCYISRLHAMDLATGAEKFGGPVAISASNFVSLRHFNRPGLLLANNTIYIGFGSHGDISNWQGWLFGYDPATLAQKFVFSTSDPANGSAGASLWGGGAGPAADASGNIYVTTGNGLYDGVSNFSESVLKISPTGTLLDWFTPSNRSTLDANDVDLGSAGMMILPDSVGSAAHPHLALATGKIAILYLLDQTNLGKFNSLTNQDVQEVIPVPPPNTTQLDGGLYGLPAYWNGFIYTTGQNYPLSQFRISNGSMATPQLAVSSNMFPPRGATPSVSANGNTNGIVWILDLSGWPSNSNAILYAYDATNVSNLLFSSSSNGTGAAGPAVKFTVPTIANGKVYVGGQSTFVVFGLLPN